jgi:hypothetical protein
VPHVTQRFLLARFAAMLTGCLIVVGALRVVLPLAEQYPTTLRNSSPVLVTTRRLLAELSQAFALKHHTPTHPHLVDRTEADNSRELRTHRD